MERISDIGVFCVVVEKGSFTAAADSLGLSKGAVSKYVSRLESRLGVRLLNRTTRRLSLTPGGEAFHDRVAPLLSELEAAEQVVTDQATSPRGHLRVSAPTFFGNEVLSPHLGEFHRRYPEISLEMALENRFVDLVGERIDVAIRMSAPRDSSLVMRRLAEIPMVACAAPAYLERYGRPDTPDDLKSHHCLIYTLARRSHEWWFRRDDGSLYSVPVDGFFRTNDDHAQRQAGLDGLGILYMPRLFLEEALERGDLIRLWPDEMTPTVTLAVVWPSKRSMPAKVRAFVDFMSELFTQ